MLFYVVVFIRSLFETQLIISPSNKDDININFKLSVCLSVCVVQSYCLYIFLSFCLSVSLSFCLSVFLSFCLSVFHQFISSSEVVLVFLESNCAFWGVEELQVQAWSGMDEMIILGQRSSKRAFGANKLFLGHVLGENGLNNSTMSLHPLI